MEDQERRSEQIMWATIIQNDNKRRKRLVNAYKKMRNISRQKNWNNETKEDNEDERHKPSDSIEKDSTVLENNSLISTEEDHDIIDENVMISTEEVISHIESQDNTNEIDENDPSIAVYDPNTIIVVDTSVHINTSESAMSEDTITTNICIPETTDINYQITNNTEILHTTFSSPSATLNISEDATEIQIDSLITYTSNTILQQTQGNIDEINNEILATTITSSSESLSATSNTTENIIPIQIDTLILHTLDTPSLLTQVNNDNINNEILATTITSSSESLSATSNTTENTIPIQIDDTTSQQTQGNNKTIRKKNNNNSDVSISSIRICTEPNESFFCSCKRVLSKSPRVLPQKRIPDIDRADVDDIQLTTYFNLLNEKYKPTVAVYPLFFYKKVLRSCFDIDLDTEQQFAKYGNEDASSRLQETQPLGDKQITREIINDFLPVWKEYPLEEEKKLLEKVRSILQSY
jgi:hypothetical protein